MAYNGSGVVSYGFPLDDFTFTYYLSGTFADDAAVAATAGKAVTLDTSADNTFKLASAGDPIHGRIYVAENRDVLGVVTASIQRRFKEKLPAESGHTIAVGDSVEGHATVDGSVDTAGTPNNTIVVEVGDDFVVVELL